MLENIENTSMMQGLVSIKNNDATWSGFELRAFVLLGQGFNRFYLLNAIIVPTAYVVRRGRLANIHGYMCDSYTVGKKATTGTFHLRGPNRCYINNCLPAGKESKYVLHFYRPTARSKY